MSTRLLMGRIPERTKRSCIHHGELPTVTPSTRTAHTRGQPCLSSTVMRNDDFFDVGNGWRVFLFNFLPVRAPTSRATPTTEARSGRFVVGSTSRSQSCGWPKLTQAVPRRDEA